MLSAIEIALVLMSLGVIIALITTQPILRARRYGADIEVSPRALEDHVRGLIAHHNRHYGYPNELEAAARHIRSIFVRASARVEMTPFDVEGDTYFNISATHGPSGGPVVIVGAHYDCVEESPGADDNASGVAALFELSRLLQKDPPVMRVELVAFALEEPPAFATHQMGSMAHAQRLKKDDARVRAMICLESIGFFSDRRGSQQYPAPPLRLIYPGCGDFIAIVGRYREIGLVRAVKRAMSDATALPVRSFNGPEFIPGISWSDHIAYWRHGYPAVMITDTALYRNPGYHTAHDRPETLDYERLARVVLGVERAIRSLTRCQETRRTCVSPESN